MFVALSRLILSASSIALCVASFIPSSDIGLVKPENGVSHSSTSLGGLFDSWKTGGTGGDSLDEEWEKQQEILKRRRAPESERKQYFEKIDKRRVKATKTQNDKWDWQTKRYKKGEDPIDEWRKKRESGDISDLENQYGDPKKIGGIPLPSASFGVGGEFGVGGKFDNGGRFDLRLPYADQGYEDDDADVMKKIGNFFSGGKGKEKAKAVSEKKKPAKTPTKKETKLWPWQQ